MNYSVKTQNAIEALAGELSLDLCDYRKGSGPAIDDPSLMGRRLSKGVESIIARKLVVEADKDELSGYILNRAMIMGCNICLN